MFKNSYQNGLLSIFYSCGSNPLTIWDMEVKNGHIKRLTDGEVNSLVLEIVSTNVATTYIRCPKNNQILGIKLPFLVMIVKNLKRYFSFEITVLDDTNMRRRFRISNFQSTTKIKPFCTSMPIGLSGGWNQIQFNLVDFTRRAYGSQFIETLSVQVHANVRIRRIYFAERLYTEEELPQEYKLYLPLERKKKKEKVAVKEESNKTAAPTKEQSQIETAKEKVANKKSTVTVTPVSEQVIPQTEPEEHLSLIEVRTEILLEEVADAIVTEVEEVEPRVEEGESNPDNVKEQEELPVEEPPEEGLPAEETTALPEEAEE